MGLSRPTRFFPDKTSGEYQAIDGKKTIIASAVDTIITNDKTKSTFKLSTTGSATTDYISTPFSFVIKGNSALVGFVISIYDMASSSTIFKSTYFTITNGIFPINYLGEDTIIKAYVPVRRTVGGDYLNNLVTSNYKWTVEVFWNEPNPTTGVLELTSLVSSEIYFESRPTLNVTEVIVDKGTANQKTFTFQTSSAVIGGLYHTFDATITPVKSTFPIDFFKWTLKNSYGNIIYDTGIVKSQDVKFTYDGFLPYSYTLELTVVNIFGNKIIKTIPLTSVSAGTIQMDTSLIVERVINEPCLRIAWGEDINGTTNSYVINELIDTLEITSKNEILGYDLYRQKRGDLYVEKVFARFTNDAFEAYDYKVVNGVEYTYYLYPIGTDGNIFGSYEVIFKDNVGVTTYAQASFDYWSLLVLSPNENKENTYRVFKEFRWYLDINDTTFKTNANISVNNNYTQFPRVQKGRTNYLTFNLQSLIGYISCDTYEYIDTQAIIDDLRALPTVDNEMVLKSPKGAIMKVAPINDISFTTQEKTRDLLTSASIELAEIGRVNNISIINKIANPVWMFTLSGFQPINTISTNIAGYTIKDGTILAPSSITKE